MKFGKLEKIADVSEAEKSETTESEKKTELYPKVDGEIFDPKLELEKIKRLPRAEKKQALEEYKEKLAEQKEGLADMQKILVKKIRENPDLSWRDSKEIIDEMGRVHKMTESQKFSARTILG